MSTMFNPCLIPKSQLKITRNRSTQRNFIVIISTFWAWSCRPIHKRLLLCCLARCKVMRSSIGLRYAVDKRKLNIEFNPVPLRQIGY